MISKSTLAIITAVAAIGIASPALAQSFDPEAGSGNVVASNVGTTTSQADQIRDQRNGLHAYAMVSWQPAAAASTAPTLNGGGSAGYNDMILKY
jgi:hypothetical protein